MRACKQEMPDVRTGCLLGRGIDHRDTKKLLNVMTVVVAGFANQSGQPMRSHETASIPSKSWHAGSIPTR